MRMIALANCQPGMVLARSVYDASGRVLLNEGVELTTTLLERLKRHGIFYLYIFDERLDDVKVHSIIPDEVQRSGVAGIRRLFITESRRVGERFYFHRLRNNIEYIFYEIYEAVQQHENTMVMMNNIYTQDAYLYTHSYQVGVYSIVLGIKLGFPKEKVFEIAVGSFLHDIGKLEIDQQVLNKPGKLTPEEYELVKTHTTIGYQKLKADLGFPLLSAHIALQHHERLDGSGYPLGLRGHEIHPYAKIVGIVDVYDAMTTNRVYSAARLPHEVMEYLYTCAGKTLDTEAIIAFRDIVVMYPIGLEVVLSNGQRGIVVDNNSSAPHRPIVRLFYGPDGEEIPPEEVDLSKRLNLNIVETRL